MANDYTAEIGNGGLRPRQETRVAMRSERLFISRAKIRVEYEFVNETPEPVETLVAFPWPGYRWHPWVQTYTPSMLEFAVEVDGRRVPHKTEIRAMAGGREISNELKAIGIDATTFGGFDDTQPSQPWRNVSALSTLKTLGALDSRETPAWMVFVTHHWSQCFPSYKTVKIVHEYVPVIGVAAYGAVSMIETPPTWTVNSGDLVANDFDVRDPGCPDAAFRRAYEVRRKEAQKDPDNRDRGLSLSWVRYILTTANTWKGPIQDFELIVERDPGDLVTFCWDGPVERIGPDRFRARRQGFRPEKDLTVYYVPSLKHVK